MFTNHASMLVYFSMPQRIQDKYKLYLQRKDILIRNGILLTQTINLLTIKCNNGHIFTTLSYISNLNIWCPECANSYKVKRTKEEWDKICNSSLVKPRWITEEKVRVLLETKLNLTLPKQRVRCFTKSLEFDGYNKEHKIAFEYNGEQHYIYPNYWHKSYEKFIKQQNNDKLKVQYCLENGIRLITIPYTIKNLETYIQEL